MNTYCYPLSYHLKRFGDALEVMGNPTYESIVVPCEITRELGAVHHFGRTIAKTASSLDERQKLEETLCQFTNDTLQKAEANSKEPGKKRAIRRFKGNEKVRLTRVAKTEEKMIADNSATHGDEAVLDEKVKRTLSRALKALGYSSLSRKNLDEVLLRVAADAGIVIDINNPSRREEFEALKKVITAG